MSLANDKWVVRVTNRNRSNGLEEVCKDFCREKMITQALMVSHDREGSELHYHIQIRCDRKEDTIRNYFKTKITAYYKGQVAVKQINDSQDDWIRSMAYLFHTKHDNVATQILNKSIKETELYEAKNRACSITDDFEKRKKERIEKKLTPKKIMLTIIEECRPALGDPLPPKHVVLEKYIKAYNEHDLKLPTRGSMEQIILTTYSRWGAVNQVVSYYETSLQYF